MKRQRTKLLSLVMAIAMVATLLPVGISVSAAITPGNITNIVTKFNSATPTVAREVAVSHSKMEEVKGSSGVPSTKYDSSTGHTTNQARIDATIANNPYFTSDKSAWYYGDRAPNAEFTGTGTNNPIYSQTQYVILNTTSPVFLGPNVSKILTLNDEKSFTPAIPDVFSFDIDKGATVYTIVPGGNATSDTNYVTNNGWTKPTGISVQKSSIAVISAVASTAPYYAVPAGGGSMGNVYAKHFDAGKVNIPSRGHSAGNGIVLFVVWDADGTGDTTLANMSYDNGTTQNIPLVPGQTVYNVKVEEGSVPVLSATLNDTTADIQITQATSLPGTATVNVISGPNTATYTINFSVYGEDIIYVDRTDTTGKSGMTYAKALINYPLVPAYSEFSTSWPMNEANAGTAYWNFNTGNGDVNITRPYTNFGGAITYMRNEGQGSGSSQYVYIKMDLSTLDPSRAIQNATLSASFAGGSTVNYNGTNKRLFVELYELAETKWITGTGTGEFSLAGTAPSKNPAPAGLKLFPYVDRSGAVVGTADVSQPYMLTWAVAPDNKSSVVNAIKDIAYANKIATVDVGPMAANTAMGTVEFDVTQTIIDKLAAGEKTATFKITSVPHIYGYYMPTTSNKNDFSIFVTDSGPSRPKLEVTSTLSGEYASSENKLTLITIGDKATYSNGNKTYAIGKSPIDLGTGFDPESTAQQTFNITTSDLVGGKVSLNAVAKDALATISINGGTSAADTQSALLTPVQGVATAQVVVTAPNSETKTYDLKFVITDYVMGTDSSLSSLTYTHPSLGTKSIPLSQGVTEYNITLPYGIPNNIPQVSGTASHPYATIESITQAASIPGSASIVVKAENATTTTYTINFTKTDVPPVVDHLPGNVTNVKTRFSNATTAHATPQTHSSIYPVQGSTVVPVTRYLISTPENPTEFLTNDDRIAKVMSNENPYFTSDKTAWSFGDRPCDLAGSGSTADSPRRGNTQFTMVEGTSPLFVGPNVTKVLTLNDEKAFTLSIPDIYSFDIDKGATVYVASHTNAASNFVANGWNEESSLKAYRGANFYPGIQGSDGFFYAIPNGVSIFPSVYSKHYVAGANVTIPSRGATSHGGMVIYVVWDECNPNVTLSDITVNGESIEGLTAGTTEYTVELPFGTTAIPNLVATPAFAGATVEVVNPSSIPGTATINITAADGVATGSYTINYTIGISNGDINADGEINISDVVMAAEIAIGYTNYTADQIIRANVSSKQDPAVDISDVIMILERVTGNQTPFPIDQ